VGKVTIKASPEMAKKKLIPVETTASGKKEYNLRCIFGTYISSNIHVKNINIYDAK
jgi:hypothetical protein